MDVLKIAWIGTRTTEFDRTTAFFAETFGLPIRHNQDDFAVLDLPDGSTVEIFGPSSAFNPHITSPVAGFLVRNLDQAHAELVNAGVEIVLPTQRSDDGAWLHFRAPDGFLYELTEKYGSAD